MANMILFFEDIFARTFIKRRKIGARLALVASQFFCQIILIKTTRCPLQPYNRDARFTRTFIAPPAV